MAVSVTTRDGRIVRTMSPGELLAELSLGAEKPKRARAAGSGGSRRNGGRRARRLAGVLGVMTVMLVAATGALATHNLGLFQLDENAVDSTGAGLPDDWDRLDDGIGDPSNDDSALASVFVADGDDFSGGITVPPGLPSDDTSYFTTGGSKDVNDINQWMHQTGDVAPDKDEILNAYAAAYVNTLDTANSNPGDLILYFGLDRLANNGDAQVGFWFFQSTHARNPDGTFSGVHQVGDILVLSHFTGGGSVDTIQVFKWVGPPDADNLLLVGSGVDCAVSADDLVCATVNDNTEDAPWPYVAKAPVKGQSENDFAPGSFYEGGLNATALGLSIGCGGSFLAETRSSQSLDAQLKDFALGDFALCGLNVTKTGDTLSKVGDPVDYTVTIENTGAITLYKDDISDDVLGAITTNGVNQANPNVLTNTCGASLANGASCTITLSRVTQAGDPDPLVNTVTAVYNSAAGPSFSGTAVSDVDGHSVNLFQPSLTVDKTGDALSKVGDSVDYTIKVCNTSSADSPALVKDSVTDSLIAGVDAAFGATLAVGACEEHNFSRTVLAGDPDPVVNTATAHYHPTGFPNDVTGSDGHSVNLFQPAVQVDKLCDPTTLQIGATVTFTCTVTNLSSVDAPNLIFSSLTDLLDQPDPGADVDLTAAATAAMNASNCTVLTYQEVCSFSYTFVASFVGLHTNTIAVHYNPEGFPNDIWDDGQCTFEATGGEGCTPGFFKRWTNVWDDSGDAISIAVKAAVEAKYGDAAYVDGQGVTTQEFASIFGLSDAQMTAAGLDPDMTMLEAINLGGGGFDAIARHGTAALLSSVSVAYPFSADAVLTMVHDAIATLTVEPTLTQLSSANNLSHQNCPKS